jgi:hypothetical protein
VDTETRPASAGTGREEREEGEIADDEDSSAPRGGALTHPLEHAWTFWFDNPQGKTRQQAWGSTIHPIHTFSTVEDFWRYPSLFFFLTPRTISPDSFLIGMKIYCPRPVV